MKTDEKVVVLCSGGLNSVTLAYQVHSATPTPEIVLFGVDYNSQRHKKEFYYTKQAAKDLELPYNCAHVEQPLEIALSSVLSERGVDVPEDHTLLNHNAILLSLAWAHAVAIGATTIYAAIHNSIYPDCRSAFISGLNEALSWGTEGYAHPELSIVTPYINLTKKDIVRIGASQLDVPVPYEKTWSCYKGGTLHCGRCGACVERKEAFQLALVDDPTEYEDPSPVPDDITLNFGANF